MEEIQQRQHESMRIVIEGQLRKFNPQATEKDILNILKQYEEKPGNHEEMMNNSPLFCKLPVEEQEMLRHQLAVLSERNRNIRQLEKDVIDLHEMFADMKLLVDQEGELVNTIEHNVEETKGRAKSGMREIIHAHNYEKKVQQKKWCIFLLVVVTVVIVSITGFVVYGRHWFVVGNDADASGVDEDMGTGAAYPNSGDADSEPTMTARPHSRGTGRKESLLSSSVSSVQSNLLRQQFGIRPVSAKYIQDMK